MSFCVCDLCSSYFNRAMGSRFCVGFSCGIPFLLRLSVLDLWLKDCGLSNSAIGFFTFMHWPYLLKFLYAPFIEKTDFPLLSRIFGRRRGWAIASQLLLFMGFAALSCCDPRTNLGWIMVLASFLAFADGCQDVSLYSFQVENASQKNFGVIASVFVFGYRIGLFFSKSVTLYLAHYYGWNVAYALMAFSVCLCTLFILSVKEPQVTHSEQSATIRKLVGDYEQSLHGSHCFLKSRIYECLVCPFQLFLKRKDSYKLLCVVLLYRVGDRVAQKMAKLFYIDLGFSMLDIANVVQVFGTTSTIVGSLIGGWISKRYGIMRSLFIVGIIHAIACFAYIMLYFIGHNITALYCTVFIENLTGGATATAFIAFLYSLSNDSESAATQYAAFWALYEAVSMVCRACSGVIADMLGWKNFFFMIPFISVPSICILYQIIRKPSQPT